jgi:hypothetical protein
VADVLAVPYRLGPVAADGGLAPARPTVLSTEPSGFCIRISADTVVADRKVSRCLESVDEAGRRSEGVAGVVGPDRGLRRPPIADPGDEARS